MKRRSIHGTLLAGAMVAAGIASLLVAGQVTAAIWVILDPDHGPPGTEVTGRTAGNGAFTGSPDPMPTYLVVRTAADRVTTPDDPALIEIGELVVDGGGNGRTSFIVPQVDPADYVMMVFCPACAPYSAGRTMLPIADFRVTPSAPNTDTDTTPDALAHSSAPILLGVVILAVAIAIAARSWPRRAYAP